MDNNELTIQRVFKVGLIVSAISGGIQFFLVSTFLSFLTPAFIGLTFFLTMSGAFLGKHLTTIPSGVWTGAIFGTIIGQVICLSLIILLYWYVGMRIPA